MTHRLIASAVLAQVAAGRRISADFLEELRELAEEQQPVDKGNQSLPKEKAMPVSNTPDDALRSNIAEMIAEDKPSSAKKKKKKTCCKDDKCSCASKILEKSRIDFDAHRP